MKKTKIFEIVLFVFIFAFLIALIVYFSKNLSDWINSYHVALEHSYLDEEGYLLYRQGFVWSGLFIGFSVLALAACAFLFVYCNPRLFRRSTWTNLSEEWAKNKEERNARKQAKNEQDKQKRIEELQAEIDELKNDTTNSKS